MSSPTKGCCHTRCSESESRSLFLDPPTTDGSNSMTASLMKRMKTTRNLPVHNDYGVDNPRSVLQTWVTWDEGTNIVRITSTERSIAIIGIAEVDRLIAALHIIREQMLTEVLTDD